MKLMKKMVAVAAVLAMGSQWALAEDASCKTVRFADVG
jgi:ABC-type proline/glycine betaine transport system substrate-binding protein